MDYLELLDTWRPACLESTGYIWEIVVFLSSRSSLVNCFFVRTYCLVSFVGECQNIGCYMANSQDFDPRWPDSDTTKWYNTARPFVWH